MSNRAGNPADAEQWLPIEGSGGMYSVSDLGRVRSEPVEGSHVGRQRGRILVAYTGTKGYLQFRVCAPDMYKTIKVHTVVALAFIGPRPDGMQINHKNGDKKDNRPDNLEYISCVENIRHAHALGLCANRARGERNKSAKLTADDIRTIRSYPPGTPLAVIARDFGISKSSTHQVIRRKTWKHVA
jgi:hypothetical protein